MCDWYTPSVSCGVTGNQRSSVHTDTIGYGYFVAALAEFSSTHGFTNLDITRPWAESGTGNGIDCNDVDATLDHGGTVIADRHGYPWRSGCQPTEIELSVYGNAEVRVRDQLPGDWRFIGGDAHTTYTDGDTRYVEFKRPLEYGTRTYFVAGSGDHTETSTGEFGPIEYSPDDGEHWIRIPETTDRNNVLGANTGL